MKNKKLRTLLIIIITAFLGGGIGVMMKIGLQNIPPFSFTFLRYFVALFIIYPFFIKENKKIIIDFEVVKLALILAVNIILFIVGLQWTSANVGQMLCLGIPMIVIIISHFLVKEKITFKKIIGIIIGLIGSFFLFSMKSQGQIDFHQMLIGNGLIVIGSIFYSFYLVLSKKIQKKFSPLYITTILNLVIMLVSLFLAFSDLYFHQYWWSHINYISIISILYVGVFATSVSYLLGQYAIKLSSPLISSLGLYIQPLFTFIWSYLLLGERITGSFIAASIIVFIGILLVSL